MRKMVLYSLLALAALAASARDAYYDGDEYSLILHYNDVACPGDAVFVRMAFAQSKQPKAPHASFDKSEAILQLLVDGKQSISAAFYSTPKPPRGTKVMLSGVPLSTWLTDESNCSLCIVYTIQGQTKMEFELPLTIEPKAFVSESIQLDEDNTQIKSDTSIKRMEQIQRLNGILKTTSSDSVWQQSAFSLPTAETRRTAYFGDRREYLYTTGGSSSGLHYGVDFGVGEGSSVYSCADGKVVLAEDRVSTGWSIVVEHLPGLYSLYYHLSSMNVSVGDVVKRGQLLGLSGSTGLATGPHLHWEVRLLGEAVNPDFFTSDFTFSAAN